MTRTKPNPTRHYSHSWEYPGYYEGYDCTIPFDDGAYCIMPPPPPGDACGSFFYDYIHLCKGYPFDLTDLDKVIDIMSNPANPFYDLNG